MLVHVPEVHFLLRLGLVVTSFQAPNVKPVRGARLIHSEQVVAHRNPFVHVFLNDIERHHFRFYNALETIMTGAQMERFFPQHRIHGLRQRLESRITQHGELEFSIAVHEIRVGEKVQPVGHFLIEGAKQALGFKCAAFQHFLGFHFSTVAEVIDQQMAHLPAVPHFFGHHAA